MWLFSLLVLSFDELQLEQVNAILITPKHMRYWVSAFNGLPMVAKCDLGPHKGLFSTGF